MVVCEFGHAARCKQTTDSLAAPVKMWAAEHNLDRYEVPKAGLEEWQVRIAFLARIAIA